jgi:hypothetical protein
MQKHQTTLSGFQFKRATADLIYVYNEGSYLMAEYSERTGVVSWQRVLLATQRDVIERWLRERYPVQPAPVVRKEARAESAAAPRPRKTRVRLHHVKKSRQVKKARR